MNFFVVQLNQVRLLDAHPEVQAGATLALQAILESGLYEESWKELYLPDGRLSVPALKGEVAAQAQEAQMRVSAMASGAIQGIVRRADD